MSRIVVGVDGSVESQEALRWALEEGELRAAEVVAVHSYGHGPSDVPKTYLAEAGKLDEARQAERQEAQELIAAALEHAGADERKVTVTRELAPGEPPTAALLERSAEADLLVIGSRGLGGFTGALLGSVSQHCVQHAACPVVVVRDGGS